ncbi:hypothetical protein LguiB_001316 [Lonicera macranthoides]
MATTSFRKGNTRLPSEVKKVIYVRNLPFNITSEEMHDIFNNYNAICQIRIGTNKDTQKIIIIPKSDGFQAHIQFQSHQFAVTTRNTLHGRNIYDGCCQLDIQLGYGDIEGKRTARCLKVILSWSPRKMKLD